MFDRFIVATDLSPASFAVVGCLGGLKAYGAAQCLLLQCLSFSDAASTALSYNTEPLKEMLEQQEDILAKYGLTVETRTVVGIPKQEIIRIAAEENYSLIVVGAQGRSLVKEKLLGGVAYGVITKSVKPVLVVPVEKKQGEDNACAPVSRCSFSDHVLFATDFSLMADNAFTYVEKLVAYGARKVTLVHVQDKTKLEKHLKARLEEFNQQDLGRLENLKQSLLKKGAPQIDIELCYGVPFQEIARLILERNAQLVVMGTQGRGFIGEFFLGSVSHNVARHSVAPVLLIPGLR
ncbi:universal stress protein [Desulfoferrobacter suflitae]|uniref:universal stress protein n=1 Tax=Desulfoferrobacter suflitae TaxID=2865782 RepID=UPI0021649B0C|nr:universal stress protein [Desulfoferrobacter suflitae]MCK8603691.1 universal stress protein [Desulfoferrobacter suflitae]